MNFIKKLTGQGKASECCGVEIREVEETKEESFCGGDAKEESCCSTSNDLVSSCC
jgi:hypothetical protein